jgi:hypothetical protein
MRTRTRIWIALLSSLATTTSALGALGGDVASVAADGARMKATARVLSAAAFSVHEIVTPAGTTIREYVSPGGRVFAVAWDGPQMPNLQQLFGEYFVPFQTAVTAKRTGRGPLNIAEPGLVVQSAGRMRAFFGRAYVPQLLPQGVSLDEIK